MKVALFPNEAIAQSKDLSFEIQTFFSKHHIQADIHTSFHVDPKALQGVDYLLSLGGDGTILKLMHHFPDLDLPILGINVGHLGFMADVQTSELFPSLQDFIDHKFILQERLVLEGTHSDGKTEFACNDIVIHRGAYPSIVPIAIHVDGSYFNTFEADGVIISTPNGSTAYSLAAGGPILSPDLDAIVITPICPHTISNRPLVISAHHEIELHHLAENQTVEIRFDGAWMLPLTHKSSCKIGLSKKKFKLVKLHRSDYYATLRTKLNWSGRLRY